MHFIKSIATFSKFKLDFDNNFSDLYAHFIIEEMERDFKDAQKFELFNPFKDEEFWYAFLEQAVQTYGRLLDEGEIIDPPKDVILGLTRLNNIQERYNYPDKKDLREAKKNDEVSIFKTLKNFRNEDALGVVKETADIAKMVLKEFVKKELTEIGKAFESTLKTNQFIDETYATNLYYYILSEQSGFTAGSGFNLLGTLREEVSGSLSDKNYTDGDELALPDGTPYVGYYHVHDGEDGEVFMVGEEHSSEDHDILRPFANQVVVVGGNSQGIGSGGFNAGSSLPPSTAPFGIRVYLKTPDGDRDPFVGHSDLTSLEGNVSDQFPGTLSLVYAGQKTRDDDIIALSGEAAGRPVVGLQGELGLRYGLEFYANVNGQMRSVTNANVNGQMRSVTSVEIDVLDVPLSKLAPLGESSKEMLCLVNNLLDDDKFKLFMRYCLPTKKLLSTIAIYNDLAFLPSIGENYVEGAKKNSGQAKPGVEVEVDDDTGEITETPTPGWFPRKERRSFTPFVRTWDEWDQQTLRRSNKQLKKMNVQRILQFKRVWRLPR
jgi:hypothetical protein